MPTWEEGQEQAQRESRNRIFGGVRSSGATTGPTTDFSSQPNAGQPNVSPYANLRGGQSGGVTPNYGFADSRYSTGGGAIGSISNSLTGPASSRAMRRSGRGGGGGDVQSGNINVNFAPQTVDQSVRTGNVAGAGATQDNRIQTDASVRNITGSVGNTLQQDASGGAGGSSTATAGASAGVSPKPRGRGTGTPRGPRTQEQKDATKKVKAENAAKRASASATATSTGGAGGAGGRNDGFVSGDINLSSGNFGPMSGGTTSTNTAVNSPTSVGSNNTANPSQQMGDNTTNTTNNTTNNTTPPSTPPTTPPSGGTTSPPPVGVPPRSTGRPTPSSGGTPTGATPPAGGRPTIPVPPAGTPPTGATPPTGGGRPTIPVQPQQRPSRLRSWLDGRGQKPLTDEEFNSEFPTEKLTPPTEVMPVTPRRTSTTPSGDTTDLDPWEFYSPGYPRTAESETPPKKSEPATPSTPDFPVPDFINANQPSEKVTLTDPAPPEGEKVTLTDPVPPKGEEVTLTDPVKKETEKKQAPRKTAAPKKEPAKKAAEKKEPAKKEPAKKAPAKPKAEPEKKAPAEKPKAEKKDLPNPEDVEVFINPDTGMPDTRPKKK